MLEVAPFNPFMISELRRLMRAGRLGTFVARRQKVFLGGPGQNSAVPPVFCPLPHAWRQGRTDFVPAFGEFRIGLNGKPTEHS